MYLPMWRLEALLSVYADWKFNSKLSIISRKAAIGMHVSFISHKFSLFSYSWNISLALYNDMSVQLFDLTSLPHIFEYSFQCVSEKWQGVYRLSIVDQSGGCTSSLRCGSFCLTFIVSSCLYRGHASILLWSLGWSVMSFARQQIAEWI